MSWLEANIGVVIQTALTVIGSGIAIWIATFQQRAIARRERQTIEYKTRSAAPVLMRELLEFLLDVAVKTASLPYHREVWPDKTENEVLELTSIELPKTMVPNLEHSQLFGPELTSLLAALQVHISFYNSQKTIPDRVKYAEEVGRRIRAVDRELGRVLK